MATYVNPLRYAHVSPERIDQGVDYAGTGYYCALGDCQVTTWRYAGWGSFGNFMEYKLLEPGPLQGVYVYYAEGVDILSSHGIHQWGTYKAGTPLVSLIPGWHSGTEIGVGAGDGGYSWAHWHGGYTEGYATRAGLWFSRLVQALGGPGGVIQPLMGDYPPWSLSGLHGGSGTPPPPPPAVPQPLPPIYEVDWSPWCESAWGPWALHGAHAYQNAKDLEALTNRVEYVTTDGAK